MLVKFLVFLISVSSIILPTQQHTIINEERRWKQPRFLLSFWVDPMVPKEEFQERYREIAEANFTAILGGFGATRPGEIEAQINAAQNANLGVIVAGGDGTASVKNVSLLSNNSSPNLWGYLVRDEPGPQDFPHLQKLTAEIASLRPGKLRLVNLFPNYATFLPLPYEEYVSQFVDQVRPDVLCFDHYPMFELDDDDPKTNRTRAGYRRNLEVLRTMAEKHNIPFWNFFNNMPFRSYADPTEAQLRWQVFTSLAYGAKGLFWFLYWTIPFSSPGGREFPLGGGILTPTGHHDAPKNYVRGPHYEHATRINSHVLAYEPYLLEASSTGVFHVVAPANGGSTYSQLGGKGCIIHDMNISQPHYALEGQFLVGQFQLADGRKAVLVNNHDDKYNVWPTVTFAPEISTDSIHEVSIKDGREKPVLDDSPNLAGLQLRLPSGSGRLLVLGAKNEEEEDDDAIRSVKLS